MTFTIDIPILGLIRSRLRTQQPDHSKIYLDQALLKSFFCCWSEHSGKQLVEYSVELFESSKCITLLSTALIVPHFNSVR